MKKSVYVSSKRMKRLEESFRMLEEAQVGDELDLSFLDEIPEDSIKDEIIRLPYEDLQTAASYGSE